MEDCLSRCCYFECSELGKHSINHSNMHKVCDFHMSATSSLNFLTCSSCGSICKVIKSFLSNIDSRFSSHQNLEKRTSKILTFNDSQHFNTKSDPLSSQKNPTEAATNANHQEILKKQESSAYFNVNPDYSGTTLKRNKDLNFTNELNSLNYHLIGDTRKIDENPESSDYFNRIHIRNNHERQNINKESHSSKTFDKYPKKCENCFEISEKITLECSHIGCLKCRSNKLCNICMNSEKCLFCNEIIFDESIKICSHVYCQKCFESLKECSFCSYCSFCGELKCKTEISNENGAAICSKCKESKQRLNVCDICGSMTDKTFTQQCNHEVCSRCLNNDLCTKCYNNFKDICEVCNSDYIEKKLLCGHQACNKCSKNEKCLHCLSTDSYRKILWSGTFCALCKNYSNITGILYCGHLVCENCIVFPLWFFNYRCLDCELQYQNYCLYCKKASTFQVEDCIYKKICCSKTYCFRCKIVEDGISHHHRI